MTSCKLLFVEDSTSDLEACRMSLLRYKNENDRDLQIVNCDSFISAAKIIDASFDGAVIDLRLGKTATEGNEIAKDIEARNFRIPILILTGTPDDADQLANCIGVHKKGEIEYVAIFDRFWSICSTGLTRIIGGRGQIEIALNEVFVNNILPQIATWEVYGVQNSQATERALLRHSLNHLIESLYQHEDLCNSEEFYLFPHVTKHVTTGSVVTCLEQARNWIILNPACDLALRGDGACKTDRVMLVEIENHDDVIKKELNGITKLDSRKKMTAKVISNNLNNYYHWLPPTDFFEGGFVNFRKLQTVSPEQLKTGYKKPHIQIARPFVKDIMARFSGFYARQGQPDIEQSIVIDKICARLQTGQESAQ